MSDVHSKEQRSRNMAAVGAKNTKPELRVRSFLHKMGFRFRLHRKELPGSPDIVLVTQKTAIFVHGCFWHCHDCKHGQQTPTTHPEFWKLKRDATLTRDLRNKQALQDLGWNVATIWECQTKRKEEIAKFVEQTLMGSSARPISNIRVQSDISQTSTT